MASICVTQSTDLICEIEGALHSHLVLFFPGQAVELHDAPGRVRSPLGGLSATHDGPDGAQPA